MCQALVTHRAVAPPGMGAVDLAGQCFEVCEVSQCTLARATPLVMDGMEREFYLIPFAGGTSTMAAGVLVEERKFFKPSFFEFLLFVSAYAETLVFERARLVLLNAEFFNGALRHYLVCPSHNNKKRLALRFASGSDVTSDRFDVLVVAG